MAMLAPEGPVYQAGTLSGNPVAAAAGLTTLQRCTDEVYARLGTVATTLAGAVEESFTRHGIPHRVQWAGSMFSVFLREGEVRDYDDARDQDVELFGRFFHAMLRRGVHLPPSCFESWFVSAAHDDEAVDHAVRAIEESAAEVRSRTAGRSGAVQSRVGGWAHVPARP
jgi:glutamate-1-semialdehyde 2,1-aminomutase